MNIERKLLALDKELHSILGILKKQRVKELEDVVEDSSGAWGYKIDSVEFVDGLRKSKRLDWLR
jgi:hypothetical protein